MNPVVRGLVVYLFLLIVFRFMGKRTLNQTTTFDFVLLLIISEVTQQGLVGEDYSITTAVVLICTLMGVSLGLTLLKQLSGNLDDVLEGVPLVIVEQGKPLTRRMDKAKVSEEDVLHAARSIFGIQKMGDIRYAILEKDGSISIIPEANK